jgi:hypothetical protein
MMYVLLEDLVPGDAHIDEIGNEVIGQNADGQPLYADGPDYIDDRCQEAIETIDASDPPYDINLTLPGCPVKVAATAPVEPVVLRANAGQCLEVALHNKLIDQAMTAADKSLVYTCENDGNYSCAGYLEPLFDAEEAQDALAAGLLMVKADGLPVTMNEVVFDSVPDLAGWQDMLWAVTRRIQPGEAGAPAPVLDANGDPILDANGDVVTAGSKNANDEMHFFNNNLIRPSSSVGLYSQLVANDASRDNGVLVGGNDQDTLARPGGKSSYRWYAGDLSTQETRGKRNQGPSVNLVATPVEFGGSNLLSADRVKQPQKGLFGALSILPAGSTVYEDTMVADGQGLEEPDKLSPTRLTRAQVTVNAPDGYAGSGGTFRENLLVGHRIANLRWWDGSAIRNIAQADLGIEGAEDSGHAGFNYGMEPSWFRFKLNPDAPWGAAKKDNDGNPVVDGSFATIPNQQAFFANALVRYEDNAIPAIAGISEAGDPQTPVFRAPAGQKARIHMLNGASADRDGAFILHGHLWQRDPFVCLQASQDPLVALEGRCAPDAVGSQALGLNPQGKYMGGEEGLGHAYSHWPILLESAGGTGMVQGDYLYRDYAPAGYRNGQFGILRVEAPVGGEPPPPEEPPADPKPGKGKNK